MGHSASDNALVAKYARSLADKNTLAVGWLPTTTYQRSADNGRIITARQNEEPCGFLHRGPFQRVTRIYQAIVQLDARRIAHATAMFERLRAEAIQHGSHQITLWCAVDLESNLFWQALGGEPTITRMKETKTRRLHQAYRFKLPAGVARERRNEEDRRYQGAKKALDLFGTSHASNREREKMLIRLER